MHVAIVAGDPGGANALIPVIKELQQVECEFTLYAYAQAFDLWVRQGWAVYHATGLDLSDVTVLLAGTSVNESMLELLWIEAARAANIPTVSLIDFWSNYRARFRFGSGWVWPDVVAVPDLCAQGEARSELPEEVHIEITGQPLLEQISSKKKLNIEELSELRRSFQIATGHYLVVFVSQPLREMSLALGEVVELDERNVLRDLEASLLQLDLPIALRVRLHPRERDDAYPQLGQIWPNSQIEMEHSAYELLQAADLIVGMNSMLLMEACYFGGKVISYLPENVADELPSNRFGWSQLVRTRDDLTRCIARQLRSQVLGQTTNCCGSEGASQRIVALLHQLCH